jgi:hypothetical protein
MLRSKSGIHRDPVDFLIANGEPSAPLKRCLKRAALKWRREGLYWAKTFMEQMNGTIGPYMILQGLLGRFNFEHLLVLTPQSDGNTHAKPVQIPYHATRRSR